MASPLNWDELRAITEGDGQLEQHLFSLYWATTERCLKKMRSLVSGDEEQQWQKAAHELKGASANIRAEAMADLCRQVEYLPDDPEERARACELLEEAYATLRTFVRQ